ncbi:C6 zinc finger domain-containing protein [Purpureocillium lavendulum]|uniref:C6 zinc finger domain-containing protein n=1 Tax=Purpureocillium lavendulum TaxID=1247861 RepID=A0AB34FFI8_9HYPO|nr:C6 zinc finger domain-containing protein [Purpureocillium lavendulum]
MSLELDGYSQWRHNDTTVHGDPPTSIHNSGTSVDKQWACGHIGYFGVDRCELLFKGCKGTSAKHRVIYEPEMCGDCQRRQTLPKPFVSK